MSIMHLTDAQLLDECRNGDQRAWSALVDRYGRLVYSVPRRYGLNDSDCDDVFAGVWAAVFRHLAQLRDETRLSAWLITTAHRESWRVGKKRPNALDLDDQIADVSSPGEDQLEQWEQQHLVRQALAKLGGPCQELLSALFLEPGVPSYESIAHRLGMRVGSIGPTRARCFRKLQKILETMGFSHEAVRQCE
jgi:RNA polymerase sigma factor (sigma-70 family)